jgi:hypothetical protein
MLETLLGPVVGVIKWVGGLFMKSRAASQVQAREHDVALFRKGDATVNEAFLDNLLNGNLYNHWFERPDMRAVGHFCGDFRREENQFLDKRAADAVGELIQALSALNKFVGVNFFPSHMPNDAKRSFLHHELRESHDEAQRDRYWKVLVPELNRLIDVAWESYKTYRATIKRRLMV